MQEVRIRVVLDTAQAESQWANFTQRLQQAGYQLVQPSQMRVSAGGGTTTETGPTRMPGWMVEKYGIWGQYAIGYSFEIFGRALQGFWNRVRDFANTVLDSAIIIEGALKRIQAVTGMSGQQLTEFFEQLQNISMQTGVPLQQMAPATYLIATRGLQTPEALETITRVSAMFSQITRQPMDQVVSMLTTFYQQITGAFPAERQAELAPYLFPQLADLIYKVWMTSPFEPGSLMQALRYALPLYLQSGRPLEELFAMLAAVMSQMAEGGPVGRYTRQLLLRLISPASRSRAEEAFAKLGLTKEQLDWTRIGLPQVIQNIITALQGRPASEVISALRDLIGDIRPTQLAAMLTRSYEAYKSYLEKYQAGGLPGLEEAFEQYIKSPLGRFQQASAEYEAALMGAKDAVLDFQTSLLKIKSGLVTLFTGLPQPLQQAVMWTGAGAGVAGQILSLVGTALSIGAGLNYIRWMQANLGGRVPRGWEVVGVALEPIAEIFGDSFRRLFMRRVGDVWKFSWSRTLGTIGVATAAAIPWIVQPKEWSWGTFASSVGMGFLMGMAGSKGNIWGGIGGAAFAAVSALVQHWMTRGGERVTAKELENLVRAGRQIVLGEWVKTPEAFKAQQDLWAKIMFLARTQEKIYTLTGREIDLSKLTSTADKFLALVALQRSQMLPAEVLYNIDLSQKETNELLKDIKDALVALNVKQEDMKQLMQTQQASELVGKNLWEVALEEPQPRTLKTMWDYDVVFTYKGKQWTMAELQKSFGITGYIRGTGGTVFFTKEGTMSFEELKRKIEELSTTSKEAADNVEDLKDRLAKITEIIEKYAPVSKKQTPKPEDIVRERLFEAPPSFERKKEERVVPATLLPFFSPSEWWIKGINIEPIVPETPEPTNTQPSGEPRSLRFLQEHLQHERALLSEVIDKLSAARRPINVWLYG